MKHTIIEAVAIVIIIIACGLVALNAFLDYKYKAEQLATPCELCVKLNPEWKKCYEIITTPQVIQKTNTNFINFSNLNLTNP